MPAQSLLERQDRLAQADSCLLEAIGFRQLRGVWCVPDAADRHRAANKRCGKRCTEQEATSGCKRVGILFSSTWNKPAKARV